MELTLLETKRRTKAKTLLGVGATSLAVHAALIAAAVYATLSARPADTAVPSAADHGLRLQAISERDGQPVALVNDRLLRVGDEVDGAKVLAIRGTEVDVEVHGRRATLHF